MEKKKIVWNVFAASPADVGDERKRLEKVIDEINRDTAEMYRLELKLLNWEPDTYNSSYDESVKSKPPDIFIGILWKSFDTPTGKTGSGSYEAFNHAYKSWSEYGTPRIFLYFNNTPFYPPNLKVTEQFGKVLDFKETIKESGVIYFKHRDLEEFERFVKRHITREIHNYVEYVRPVSTPPVSSLPFQFYQALFRELDDYIARFEQLGRDYDRELEGKHLQFAVDFSEIHDYMYPYSFDSPRAALNQYVFHTIENPLTLMPGAVAELLTELERTFPKGKVMDQDPMKTYENVATFIKHYPRIMNDEEKVIRLYSQAEEQLKWGWGELFKALLDGERHTALYALKSLIETKKLSPIEGIKKIDTLPKDVRDKAQLVRSGLDYERPETPRNNQVDTIDFAVTWMLNTERSREKKRYVTIYTQSRRFIQVCTASGQLKWEKDYLVRGAQYLKFRTRIQEIFTSTEHRRNYVREWVEKCRKMQKEIRTLNVLENEPTKLEKPSLELLDLYRQFDEECRMPLIFTEKMSEIKKIDIRNRASKLYHLIKEKGEFMGRAGESFDVLKKYLEDLHRHFNLFAPEKVEAQDSKTYMENLKKWLESENLEKRNI